MARSPPVPTAIKRQIPDSSQKILAEELAFAPWLQLGSLVDSLDSLDSLAQGVVRQVSSSNGTSRLYPPFVRHVDLGEDDARKRVAFRALQHPQRRAACPSGMNSCGDSGSPNKCCQQGTYCTAVPDTDVGHVACCPDGSTCGGAVGSCPPEATSCAASLGGGCCIPGYVCQGEECVPSASATRALTTRMQTSESHETITSTQTTVVGGVPSTVIVTVTRTVSPEVTTQTTTELVTPRSSSSTATTSESASATGNPPWRPTGSSEETSAPESTSSAQTGCPTGFYGCLATHGGGCCRTERDCHTYSCPPPSSTTIVSGGATIVVPVPARPTDTASCAGGWYLCDADAGPTAGCCPSGYRCGTASCFATGATGTANEQKQIPDQSSARKEAGGLLSAAYCFLAVAWLIFGAS